MKSQIKIWFVRFEIKPCYWTEHILGQRNEGLKTRYEICFWWISKVTGEVLGEASADINNKIERENNLVVKTVQNIPQTQNER